MTSPRRDSGHSELTLHISERQKSNLVQKNIKVRKEKVHNEEIIDLERAQFERKLNQEAKSLIRTLKLPKLAMNESRSLPSSPILCRSHPHSNHHDSLNTPRSPAPRRGSIKDILEPTTIIKPGNKTIETIISPPSLPSSPLQTRKNLDNDQQTLIIPRSATPRRGSMNDISRLRKGMDTLMSPPSPRRGSLGNVSTILSLQQRRNTITPLSPLWDKPLSSATKHLKKRELVRRASSNSIESPPDSPKATTLEEQFKQLESCRYLRRRESQDDEEDDISSVFATKQT